MKLILIKEIRNYFYSTKLKTINDSKYKYLVNEVYNLKTKKNIEYSDFIERKKAIIIHHFEAFFKYNDVEKRKLEIEKAIEAINEIGED